jgi:(p)ppGpp synthase/HD superfamily hydrolase
MKPKDPDSVPLFSPLLEAATRLAARGHYHQFRKRTPTATTCADNTSPLPSTCVPYVTHLMGTMCILARLGARDEILAAALLHDYLEDVPDPDGRTTIREAVGSEVLELVLEVTENKRPELEDAITWEIRKTEQLKRIGRMPEDAVLIKAADVLHNLQSLLSDLDAAKEIGSVWEKLNASPDRQLWYFESVLGATRSRLGSHTLVCELETAISRVAPFVRSP